MCLYKSGCEKDASMLLMIKPGNVYGATTMIMYICCKLGKYIKFNALSFCNLAICSTFFEVRKKK